MRDGWRNSSSAITRPKAHHFFTKSLIFPIFVPTYSSSHLKVFLLCVCMLLLLGGWRPFRKILRNKSPTSWGFLASCGATNLHSMTRGYSFMPGGVFEHILARLRASYCARFPFFRGWVRIVSSFSGTSPGSTVCFCSFFGTKESTQRLFGFLCITTHQMQPICSIRMKTLSKLKLEYELKI